MRGLMLFVATVLSFTAFSVEFFKEKKDPSNPSRNKSRPRKMVVGGLVSGKSNTSTEKTFSIESFLGFRFGEKIDLAGIKDVRKSTRHSTSTYTGVLDKPFRVYTRFVLHATRSGMLKSVLLERSYDDTDVVIVWDEIKKEKNILEKKYGIVFSEKNTREYVEYIFESNDAFMRVFGRKGYSRIEIKSKKVERDEVESNNSKIKRISDDEGIDRL